MNTTLSISDLLTVSLCLWGLYCIYLIINISRFIVKRYEIETSLIETIFFREHATFSRHIPDLFSSGIYATHLMMCLWGWAIFENNKAFRDIKDPEAITRHFSTNEISQVKRTMITGVVIALHAVLIEIL